MLSTLLVAAGTLTFAVLAGALMDRGNAGAALPRSAAQFDPLSHCCNGS